MPLAQIKLVCFDLGGVLVRIAGGWKDACARAGVAVPIGDHKAHNALMLELEGGKISETEYLRRAPGCFTNIGADDLRAIFDAWLIDMYPGAAQLLADLPATGMRTACLSNTNPPHWRRLISPTDGFVGLAQLDDLFASHLIGCVKPDRAAYRHVEAVTCIAAQSILFYDDREENVARAIAAGWQTRTIAPDRDPIVQIREHLSDLGVLGSGA